MTQIEIFQRALWRTRRSQQIEQARETHFLYAQMQERLLGRFEDLFLQPRDILAVGFQQKIKGLENVVYAVPTEAEAHLFAGKAIVIDDEFVPFAANQFDVILHMGSLHMTNDLPGSLLQYRRLLKDGGYFLCGMMGGSTLIELREAFLEAEIALYNGASAHVHPVARLEDIAGLMGRAGFLSPVVTSDVLTVLYKDLKDLWRDISASGERNAMIKRRKTLTHPRAFEKLDQIYRQKYTQDQKLTASFEMIFAMGKKT